MMGSERTRHSQRDQSFGRSALKRSSGLGRCVDGSDGREARIIGSDDEARREVVEEERCESWWYVVLSGSSIERTEPMKPSSHARPGVGAGLDFFEYCREP